MSFWHHTHTHCVLSWISRDIPSRRMEGYIGTTYDHVVWKKMARPHTHYVPLLYNQTLISNSINTDTTAAVTYVIHTLSTKIAKLQLVTSPLGCWRTPLGFFIHPFFIHTPRGVSLLIFPFMSLTRRWGTLCRTSQWNEILYVRTQRWIAVIINRPVLIIACDSTSGPDVSGQESLLISVC